MLNTVLSQFNNREYALIFLFGILLLLALTKKDIRKSISNLVFTKFLWQMLFIITSYNILITFILYKLGIWNIGYFKESLYWFLGSSLVFFFRINQVDEGRKFFKNTLLQILGITAMLGFLLNSYTFSFLIELILQSVLLIVILLLSFTEINKDKDPKYESITKFLNYILGGIIILLLLKFIDGILENYSNFLKKDSFIHFLYPIFYLGLFYPFLYILRLLMQYELLFTRIVIRDSQNKSDYLYVKWKIFVFCKFNLGLLNNLSRGRSFWMEKKNGINTIITEFKGK